MTNPKAIVNWSGGKDSSMTLNRILNANKHEITALFTTVNERYRRISQHGVRMELLEEQARRIDLPLQVLMLPDTPTMESYNRMMGKALTELQRQGVSVSIFGDIFLEDLREYREQRLNEVGFDALFPLWNEDTAQLARSFIDDGFRAIVVCVDERKLDESFVGRTYDESFLQELPPNVDPCGENGEFHTFVYDGPIFRSAVPFTKGEIVYRAYVPPESDSEDTDDENEYRCGDNDQQAHMPTGFWYCDLLPKT
jgi:uncharacterized protein (TIGR00290 family)